MKLLLFDLDGTLIHCGGAGRNALDKAIERLFGAKNACAKFNLSGRTDRENFILAYKKSLQREPTEDEYFLIQAKYLELLPREIKRSLRNKKYFPIPGVNTLLTKLSKRPDVLLGLGTGNIEQGAVVKLAPSGLYKHFVFGGFGGESPVRKAMLQQAVAEARLYLKRKRISDRILKKDVFVIGDTPKDVQAGRAAGFRTIAVATGSATYDELKKSRPDVLAADYRNPDQWMSWFGLNGK